MRYAIIKKAFYQLLCNKLTGSLIVFLFKDKIPDIRWKGYAFTLRDTQIPASITASIFWGFYESAEIRFAEKYFRGNMNVLEMGGSCGIVSAHLVSKLHVGKKLISVEANSNLRAIWEENTRRYNHNASTLILLNNAIHYGSDAVAFHISGNTTESSAVNESKSNVNTIQIPAITLSKIVDVYQPGDYMLVCDIEGAEAAVFLNEDAALVSCKAILIELHTTTYKNVMYPVEALKKIIESKDFHLIDSHGPVFYFERSTKNITA
jgi:FkbM family methyltransferase